MPCGESLSGFRPILFPLHSSKRYSHIPQICRNILPCNLHHLSHWYVCTSWDSPTKISSQRLSGAWLKRAVDTNTVVSPDADLVLLSLAFPKRCQKSYLLAAEALSCADADQGAVDRGKLVKQPWQGSSRSMVARNCKAYRYRHELDHGLLPPKATHHVCVPIRLLYQSWLTD